MNPNREMTDIHMHLIPGVDDGAEDMERSLIMIMGATEEGVRTIFATPHNSAFDTVPQRAGIVFQQLCSLAARYFSQEYPDLRLCLGCEVFCEPDRMAEIIEALHSGRYPTMNGTKYVLMEFSQWVMPEMTLPCVEALVNAGYIPIIAHMERYQYLCENMELVEQFRALGARIQVNAYSLFDEMKDSIKNWARRLVLERKVDFLGTDAHRPNHRPPRVRRGLNWLYENVESEYADAISWGNAQKLLKTTI